MREFRITETKEITEDPRVIQVFTIEERVFGNSWWATSAYRRDGTPHRYYQKARAELALALIRQLDQERDLNE